MNVLIDTNVVLDVFLKREPFFEHSQLILLAAEKHYLNAYVSASSVTDIFYVTRKTLKSKETALDLLKNHLVNIVDIATVDGDIIFPSI